MSVFRQKSERVCSVVMTVSGLTKSESFSSFGHQNALSEPGFMHELQIIKAVIIDDESKARINLKNVLAKCEPGVEVQSEFGSPEEVLRNPDVLGDVDCLFLDIQMPGLNGFDFLEQIDYSNMMVVFVTAYSSYALRAIKANALDYILKPIKISELRITINKLYKRKEMLRNESERSVYSKSLENSINHFYQKTPPKITIPTRHGFKIIDSAELCWVQADGNYSWIHLNGERAELVTRTIGHFEDILDSEKFVRVHNSSLINLDFLAEFSFEGGGTAFLKDGTSLNIAKRRLKTFKQRVDAYYS
ncbi:MAG: response regulator transcription factor [Bacteroidia bacterium]|nr:response regulator transcription factor [Bacteroidia bacterium]